MISKDEQLVIDSVAEIAAVTASALYTEFLGKSFTPKEAFKLTQVFLYETVKDADKG